MVHCMLVPPAGAFRNEGSLRIYREDEAYPAVELPFSCDLQRPFDGRGSNPCPAREVALTNLDGHANPHRCTHLLHSVSLQDATTRRVATHRAANPMLAAGRRLTFFAAGADDGVRSRTEGFTSCPDGFARWPLWHFMSSRLAPRALSRICREIDSGARFRVFPSNAPPTSIVSFVLGRHYFWHMTEFVRYMPRGR